jgi:hypothetical protein
VVEINGVGDVILSDARTFEALADADRFDLVERMRKVGPATADDLASVVGKTIAEVQAMLDVLADVGLVTADGERWSAVGRGLLFSVPDDPDGQRAARRLAAVMMLRNEGVPRLWATEHEPRLDPAWFQATGMLNARLTMTTDELIDLQEQIEHLIEPYLNRDRATPGTGGVQLLAYFLPSARA